MSDQEMLSESEAAKSGDTEVEAAPRPKRSGERTRPRIPGVPAGKPSRAVQMRSSAPASEGVHDAAARGLASPTTALPFADAIQTSFGSAHDVSRIQAHVGGDAAGAMGATAFASGDHVVFDQQPDLHTAAHEAAHVIQQAHGVNLYGGVGEAGDAYEHHADEVADRVVAGKSAADLLGAPTSGTAPATAVQMKEKKISDATMAEQDAQQRTTFTYSLDAVRQALELGTVRIHDAATAVEKKQTPVHCRIAFDLVEAELKRLGDEVPLQGSGKAEVVPNVKRLNGAFARFETAWDEAVAHFSNFASDEQLAAKPTYARGWLVSLNKDLGIEITERTPRDHNPANRKSEVAAQLSALEANIEGVRETARFVRMALGTGAKSVVSEHVKRLRSHVEELAAELSSGTPAVLAATKTHQKLLKGALDETRSLEKEVAGTPLASEVLATNWKVWIATLAHPPQKLGYAPKSALHGKTKP